jgi:hypothetical protein
MASSRARLKAQLQIGPVLCVIVLALSGCTAAPYAGYYAATLGPWGLMAGSALYNSIEQADISASVQEANKAELSKVRRVAIIAGIENSPYAYVPWYTTDLPAGSGISEGLVNGVATSLTAAEVDVVDTFTIERALSHRGATPQNVNGREVYKRVDIVDAAFSIGAEAVLLLSAVSGMEVGSRGFPWWGATARTDVTVKTVSGRLLNKHGDMLLTVNVTYKNGQPPQLAGEAFGLVTATKMRDPDADPKQLANEAKAV